MRRQSSLKQRKDQTSGENGADWADPADGERLVHEDHILLDVWSIKQGALRLQTMPFAVVLVAIMGLYFCIGAILNYNEIDADQRDMVTNMRIMLPGRMAAHEVSKEKCRPEAVGVHTDSGSVTTLLETISKSRERLSDPRLLGYTEIVHPMVMMRQRNKGDFMDVIAWDYYTARLPQITFPPFRWDASLFLNMTFKIDPNDILQATQMFNSWPPAARPKLSYNLRDNHNNVQVWIVQASFGASVRAYRISNPDAAGVVTVEHVKKVVLETSYDAMDVPATEVQTDVAAADYNKGQPVFKKIMVDTNVSAGEKMQVSCEQYFNLDAKCRQTIYVPRVHKVSAVEYAELYKGTWPGARTGLASPPVVELSVEVRDLQQPRPYSPEFVGFGQPFFVGFGFLISAVLLLFLWMGLRFYVVNKHVRENEGKPPMFYQGMLRFRGW